MRAPGEDDEAETVLRASFDERPRRRLRDEEAVLRLEVLRGHRARGVEGDDDVDPLRPRLGPLEADARPGERHDEAGVAEAGEHEREVPETDAPARREPRDERERRDDEGAVPRPLAEDAERDRDRQHEEEQEEERVAERKPGRDEVGEEAHRRPPAAFAGPGPAAFAVVAAVAFPAFVDAGGARRTARFSAASSAFAAAACAAILTRPHARR